MKKLVFTLLFVGTVSFAQARVYLCREDGSGCERIDRVRIDGEWFEADCDNVQIPAGWKIECCC